MMQYRKMDKNGHLHEIQQPSGKYLSFSMVVALRLKKNQYKFNKGNYTK